MTKLIGKNGGSKFIKKISTIKRIENAVLYNQFKLDSTRRNDEYTDLLFHGTTHASADAITREGFDLTYVDRKGSSFGYGLYYARKFSYLAQKRFTVPDAVSGEKNILVCRVHIGRYKKGKKTTKKAPSRIRFVCE